MAIQYKDYYQILGVSRTASQDEIKQAYRKLARKHHPDVARGESGSEARFTEINEAYEVLKDPEKRRKYDRMGPNADATGGFQPPPQWRRGEWRQAAGAPEGFGFSGTGFSNFFEAFFGSGRMGGDAFGDPFADPGMEAEAFRRPAPRRGNDLEADIMVTLEEAIHGSKRQISVKRNGGVAERYQVRIPPGVRQGQLIRLGGKGEKGTGGGLPGDPLLRVRLSEHPFLRVEGSDIYYDLALAPWEAILGARVQVSTPSGKVALKVPPGTVAGKKFRLPHHGLPKGDGGRGDMYAVAEVHVPSTISQDEKELWEKLARVSGFQPRVVDR